MLAWERAQCHSIAEGFSGIPISRRSFKNSAPSQKVIPRFGIQNPKQGRYQLTLMPLKNSIKTT